MAVVHFSLPDSRAVTELMLVAKSAGQCKAARALQRAREGGRRSVSLTSTELRALHERADQLPPRVRPVIAGALVQLTKAEEWERARDEIVKPEINRRRHERMRELGHA